MLLPWTHVGVCVGVAVTVAFAVVGDVVAVVVAVCVGVVVAAADGDGVDVVGDGIAGVDVVAVCVGWRCRGRCWRR